ncbi:MAG: hypothetical protein J5833_02345 [Victivallales bacterium]|nr:hypothetical protein [Victivallales bacterium]
MFDLLEKSFILGLGALTVTKNTAEKFVDEAIKQSKLTPEEGSSFLKTFEEEGAKARKELEDKVVEVIRTHGASLLPSFQKQIDDLEKKVADLEAKLAADKK